jgi:hypothetical protein
MPARTLDLHGKTWAESLAEFREFYNGAARSHPHVGVLLEVVHGYGSTGQGGRLQTSMRTYLERQSKAGLLSYRTGEAVDGNPGHTLITTLKLLPAAGDDLADGIWEFCARPQTHSKVMNRFRRHGDPQVQRALRELQGQKRLKSVAVGREKGYQAV